MRLWELQGNKWEDQGYWSHMGVRLWEWCGNNETIVRVLTTCRSQTSGSGVTTNQAVSRHVTRTEALGGLVYDIKIENFDIAYGNQ